MASRDSPSTRRGVKQGSSIEDARRKREEGANEIRKNKREDQLQKRRNMVSSSNGMNLNEMGGMEGDQSNNLKENISFSQENLPQIVSSIQQTANVEVQLQAVTHVRKLLSIEKNPPIAQIIEAGLVPKLVELLGYFAQPKIQFEAAWALTNIASGSSDQTAIVISNGAVPKFISLLTCPDSDLAEQAVWALGNITGDSPQCRDYVLQCGILVPLLQILQGGNAKQSMLRNATWSLSNLCRGKPPTKFQLIAPAVPTLARLTQSTDNEVLVDALWALSYLTDTDDTQLDAVLSAGFAPRVVDLLSSAQPSIQTPALRVVGNIVTGNDVITQRMLDLRILPHLYTLLHSTRKGLRKEAAWAISNITAGNKTQTQQVIEANLIPQLVHLLTNSEFEVKKEAAWALSNATTWKSSGQISYLVNHGVIKPFVDLIKTKDAKMIGVALEALENILHAGANHKSGNNPYCLAIEEADGLDVIEQLQEHESSEIYERAQRILEDYFDTEEDDENAAPTSNYSFQSTSVPSNGFVF
eukprot:TRINITY_DN15063_c0_g1_i1.p1 TRINITY_DN15063_c0_g1~~TRINITY_DN15063_c0_g1_i1.p1  ORF type:complete len:528 (-),score=216.69 TRINITY_DN15063_c0_g1_i1:261-1844(-)